jgi:hypothetical protein
MAGALMERFNPAQTIGTKREAVLFPFCSAIYKSGTLFLLTIPSGLKTLRI